MYITKMKLNNCIIYTSTKTHQVPRINLTIVQNPYTVCYKIIWRKVKEIQIY